MIFFVFQPETSGIFFNEWQSLNIALIVKAFDRSHLDISGKIVIFLHSMNIWLKSLINLVFHFEISGKFVKEEHFSKIALIL